MVFSMTEAFLLLEDKTLYRGWSPSLAGSLAFGELVFNTALTGYQEILSDPSYAGQNVLLTYPEIGNYGIIHTDDQAQRPLAKALIAKNLSPYSPPERESLASYLARHQIPALFGVDTRAITRKIRNQGAMRSLIAVGENLDLDKLQKDLLASPQMNGLDLTIDASSNARESHSTTAKRLGKIALFDFGFKREMSALLLALGFDLEIFPAASSAKELIDSAPDGIFLSNGPGDPAACHGLIRETRELLANYKKPIFGVCLGHQILAEAIGAKTAKMSFGHRGSNHPVLELSTGRVFITSQNHGFEVLANTVPAELASVTHRSLNDGSVEGLALIGRPVFSVQFHPEAAPGPHDCLALFDTFTEAILAHAK